MKRLIIFLIRHRLGLRRNEHFKFYNQRSPYDYYYFTDDALIKMIHREHRGDHWWQTEQSRCSLNWLLNDSCKIVKIDDNGRLL